MAGYSLYSVDIENFRAFAVKRVKQLPYEKIQVTENQLREVGINGNSGFEYDFKASKGPDRPEELIFVVMLSQGSNYYLLIGNAFQDFEPNLELFKQISRTFYFIEQ